MQIPKSEIRNDILSSAKAEFLKNGFERASVRTITKNAKTSKSNLYNYFEDKDALFHAVVEPTVSGLEDGLKKIAERNAQLPGPYSVDAQKKVMLEFVNFVHKNAEEFKLLFFHSAGSSLSHFKSGIIEKLAQILKEWARIASPGKEISDLLTYSVASFYICTIERILLEDVAIEQGPKYMDEFLKFIYGGWSALL